LDTDKETAQETRTLQKEALRMTVMMTANCFACGAETSWTEKDGLHEGDVTVCDECSAVNLISPKMGTLRAPTREELEEAAKSPMLFSITYRVMTNIWRKTGLVGWA
jgi:hypothetical protein